MGPDHTPLSKRHGATSVAEFRAKGYLPEALVNYLALIGWSPGGGDELLPIEELARRFSLDDVGQSAGVFDEEKLAWVNRHYLKMAPRRRDSPSCRCRFFRAPACEMAPDCGSGIEFLASVMPIASASVDRLDQVPARLAFLFDYDAASARSRCARRGGDERGWGASRRSCAGRGARAGAAARSREVPRAWRTR